MGLEEEDDNGEDEAEEEQELMVPRVKVAEDDKIEKQAGESPDTVEDEVDNNMAEGDLEMAEKENEDSSNVLEPGDNTSATRNRNKRKAEKEAKEVSSKEPKLERKNRKRIKKSVDDEVLAIFGDSDDDVTDSQSAAEQAVSSTKGVAEENGKETVPKSAQSRGRLRKSLPNIGKKGAKRTSKSPEKSKDDGFTENVDCNDDHIMVEAEASDLEGRKAKKIRRVLSSDEECTAEDLEEQHDTSTVQEEMLDKPTRSGRIPKLSKSLKQAEEDDKAVSPPTSPPAQKETSSTEHSKRRTGKSKPNLPATNRKGCMSNSKLVSLQPSSPEVSKDDCNNEQEEGLCPTNPEEQTLFPLSEPAGLSSPVPLPEEVQETMEESLCSPEAPECVVSAIPDMVASEPIKEVNPTEEFTTSGELDQEPSETGSSARDVLRLKALIYLQQAIFILKDTMWIPVNEEENNAENDQPITPKLSEKRDEQSLKLDKTLREAGLLEGVADMATSVQSVLPKKGLALGSQHNLRQTVEGMPVTTGYTESEPTFVLTLFSVNDEPFPPPLESTDPQPELLVTESEPQSSKALLDSTVEAWPEGSEVSNLFISDPFVPLCEDQERVTKQDQMSEWCTPSDQKHSTVDPEDLSEKKPAVLGVAEPHASQALSVAESHASVVTDTEEHTYRKTQPPLSPKG
ncbi:hypothetical protein Z043_117980, partial [Scleropages formosus]